MHKIESLINREMFNSLLGSVSIVEICTESVKYLWIDCNPIYIACIFSLIISLCAFLLNENHDFRSLMIAVLNTFPIFLCSIGVYQVFVKPIIGGVL